MVCNLLFCVDIQDGGLQNGTAKKDGCRRIILKKRCQRLDLLLQRPLQHQHYDLLQLLRQDESHLPQRTLRLRQMVLLPRLLLDLQLLMVRSVQFMNLY